eukprot:TRINITY_DN42815_c0_g1_i1.p1 TRINITY_DN42815_c0_g1~~TRINITY_DN42815_c0_g1_i1.p1  ORF type:complete len:233 (+),score=42.30 TRINITY_DN42815_c0_g1_i1:109-807(+)
MIIRLLSDGCFLADKEVVSVNPKRTFGSVLGIILKKLGLNNGEGYGMWMCEEGQPPLPFIPVERSDTPEKLGVKHGDILYLRKETQSERRIAKREAEELKLAKSSNAAIYRESMKVARRVEAARQKAARRLRAMNLLGTEWTLLDPENLPPSADSCCVCLQHLALTPADPIELVSCFHHFHESCLLAWIGKGTGLAYTKCPVCRARIRGRQANASDSESESESDVPIAIIRA